jgi:hypothetical protein
MPALLNREAVDSYPPGEYPAGLASSLGIQISSQPSGSASGNGRAASSRDSAA